MRNLGKAEALVEAAGRTLGKTLMIKQLDVCNEDSIKACVASLPDGKLDILSKYGCMHTSLSCVTCRLIIPRVYVWALSSLITFALQTQ